MIFKSVGELTGKGWKEDSTAIISENQKVLEINVTNLNYPGAYVQIPAVIKNEGTVDAKLTGITTEGVVVFPAIQQEPFQIIMEASTYDWNQPLQEYIFDFNIA